MGLFGWNDADRRDYETWMETVRKEIADNILYKALKWSYNFQEDEPILEQSYEWEEEVEQNKPMKLSSVRRSTISTTQTLQEDTLEQDIPLISEFQFRFLLEPQGANINFRQRSLDNANQGYIKRCFICSRMIELSESARINTCGHGFHIVCIENTCGHGFHIVCIENSTRSLPNCLICRNELRGL